MCRSDKGFRFSPHPNPCHSEAVLWPKNPHAVFVHDAVVVFQCLIGTLRIVAPYILVSDRQSTVSQIKLSRAGWHLGDSSGQRTPLRMTRGDRLGSGESDQGVRFVNVCEVALQSCQPPESKLQKSPAFQNSPNHNNLP